MFDINLPLKAEFQDYCISV